MTDRSDTADFLAELFVALDTARAVDKPKRFAAFPYVNGRLFTMSPTIYGAHCHDDVSEAAD